MAIAAYVLFFKKKEKTIKVNQKAKSAAPPNTTQSKVETSGSGSESARSLDEVPAPGSLRVGSSGIDSKVPSRTGTEEFLPGQGEFKSTIPDPVWIYWSHP